MRVRRSRADQVLENHVRLMAAARKVFTRSGFHTATLDAVAREAGLTKGAVYARFESKADLMFALLEERVTARTAAMMAVAVPSSRHGTAGALAKQFSALVREDLDWALLVAEFRVHVARDRGLNRRFRSVNERLRAQIANAVQHAGVPAAAAEELACVSMALASGLALERGTDPRSFPEALFERAAHALVREVPS